MKRQFLRIVKLALFALIALTALPSMAAHKYVFVETSTIPWDTAYIHYFYKGGSTANEWSNSQTMTKISSNLFYYDIGDYNSMVIKEIKGAPDNDKSYQQSVDINDVKSFNIYQLDINTNNENKRNVKSISGAKVYLGSKEMSGTEGSYSLTNVVITDNCKVYVKNGDTTLLTFGASASINGTSSATLTLNGGELNITPGRYNVTFDASTLTLAFTKCTESWVVMVASSGSSSYTSQSTTVSYAENKASIVSDEFTIHAGDHFYLKGTISDSSTSYCNPDGSTSKEMTIDMQDGNTSGKYITYMGSGTPGTSNGIVWKRKDYDDAKIKICFSYTHENPYNIYNTGNEVISAPAAPSISCDGSTVTITNNAGSDATVYYTTDGNDPTTSSTVYSGPFTISETKTVKAIASKDNLTSAVTTVICEYEAPYSFYVQNDANWEYVKLWAWDSEKNNLFETYPGYDILKDFDESKIKNYSCHVVKGHIGYDVVYKVTLHAKLENLLLSEKGDSDKSKKSEDLTKANAANHLFKTSTKNFGDEVTGWEEGDPAERCVKPTIHQSSNSNKITISTTTTGASIYYTIDGTDPTNNISSNCFLYSDSFYITEDCTIKAIACKKNVADSEMAEESVKHVNAFSSGVTYYIDASLVSNWSNDNSFPVIYYDGGKVSGTSISGKDRYYSFVLPKDQLTTIYIQRATSSWESGENLQVTMSAPTNGNNMVKLNADAQYKNGKYEESQSGTWTTYVAEKWEVMVKKNSESAYTAVPVTINGSSNNIDTMISNEFSVDNGTLFYLKHTFEGGSTVKYHGTHSSTTTMNLTNTSSNKIGYFDQHDNIESNEVKWDSDATSIKLCFQYNTSENGNPYYIYYTTEGTSAAEEYYLLGDINRWLSVKTYHVDATNTDYSYEYDYRKYGRKDDYKFTQCTEEKDLGNAVSTLKRTDTPEAIRITTDNEKSYAYNQWYKLKIPDQTDLKYSLDGRLFGQFTIYKGGFEEKVDADSKTVYYCPTWSSNGGKFTQWSWNGTQQQACKDNYENGLERNQLMKVHHDGSNANIQLAHNYFDNATIYFNPEADYIYVDVNDESDVQDIYIYHARLSYKNLNSLEGVTVPKVTFNAQYLNSNNYALKVPTEAQSMEPMANDATNPVSINGSTDYKLYWRLRLLPGMENPAGQKITFGIVTGDSDYDNSNFVSEDSESSWIVIDNGNVYLTDGAYVFLDTSKMYYKDYKLNVTNVECRVYGYSKDGATIQVCGADHNFVTDPSGAKGSSSWVTLTRGKIKENQSIGVYDTDFSTKWEDSKEGDYWSTYSANSDNSFFVSPVNATKFIQYKITGTIGGKENSSRSNVRAADLTVGETIVNYIPDFFCTERPASTTDSNDEELSQYMYVLTGQNKIVSVSSGIETGIEEILDEEEAQEAVEGVEVETIYYNLQGQRVKNPDHGIYIRVHGNKVTKVAL